MNNVEGNENKTTLASLIIECRTIIIIHIIVNFSTNRLFNKYNLYKNDY